MLVGKTLLSSKRPTVKPVFLTEASELSSHLLFPFFFLLFHLWPTFGPSLPRLPLKPLYFIPSALRALSCCCCSPIRTYPQLSYFSTSKYLLSISFFVTFLFFSSIALIFLLFFLSSILFSHPLPPLPLFPRTC